MRLFLLIKELKIFCIESIGKGIMHVNIYYIQAMVNLLFGFVSNFDLGDSSFRLNKTFRSGSV